MEAWWGHEMAGSPAWVTHIYDGRTGEGEEREEGKGRGWNGSRKQWARGKEDTWSWVVRMA